MIIRGDVSCIGKSIKMKTLIVLQPLVSIYDRSICGMYHTALLHMAVPLKTTLFTAIALPVLLCRRAEKADGSALKIF